MQISMDGTVTQGGLALGKLDLADFPPGSLAKQGVSMFRPVEGAAPDASEVEVHQGKLEGSNVASAESACGWSVSFVSLKCFRRTISISADMNRRALEEVARVGQ